jgi:hypothetical protein
MKKLNECNEHMTMRLLKTLLPTVVLVSTLAVAQGSNASLASTLTWIGGHFETSIEYTRVLSEHQSTTTTMNPSMSFQGCQVTLSTDQQFLHIAADGTRDTKYSGTVTEQFELSNLRADKIKVVTRDSESCYGDGNSSACPDKQGVAAPPQLITLILPAINRIPTKDAVWGPSSTNTIQIHFSTQDMADRQAKAWSAAIAACKK